jgi:hypothetical protein
MYKKNILNKKKSKTFLKLYGFVFIVNVFEGP